jgi:prolyl-tRNA editing enzyme YbaK/EbsC (Cys-tRNA(Pro) deacylase)
MNRYGSADRKAPTTTETNPAALTIANAVGKSKRATLKTLAIKKANRRTVVVVFPSNI